MQIMTEQEKADQAEMAALQRKQHGRRLLEASKNFTVTGLRMSNPADEHATGVVVVFTPEEQVKMMSAVQSILKARK